MDLRALKILNCIIYVGFCRDQEIWSLLFFWLIAEFRANATEKNIVFNSMKLIIFRGRTALFHIERNQNDKTIVIFNVKSMISVVIRSEGLLFSNHYKPICTVRTRIMQRVCLDTLAVVFNLPNKWKQQSFEWSPQLT